MRLMHHRHHRTTTNWISSLLHLFWTRWYCALPQLTIPWTQTQLHHLQQGHHAFASKNIINNKTKTNLCLIWKLRTRVDLVGVSTKAVSSLHLELERNVYVCFRRSDTNTTPDSLDAWVLSRPMRLSTVRAHMKAAYKRDLLRSASTSFAREKSCFNV